MLLQKLRGVESQCIQLFLWQLKQVTKDKIYIYIYNNSPKVIGPNTIFYLTINGLTRNISTLLMVIQRRSKQPPHKLQSKYIKRIPKVNRDSSFFYTVRTLPPSSKSITLK